MFQPQEKIRRHTYENILENKTFGSETTARLEELGLELNASPSIMVRGIVAPSAIYTSGKE